ncbi:hypothetical protein [Nocardioides sp. zg-DK7169]|uniref:hypothetical protein n=1 Tax=Nocardioides sp. zg-DK7169 TaxID=2736600 RepID=UPI0015539B48|nr:hypothetical protein [Nocardioides sp. zg-DK7169]NPC98828.1 hypothetical protein [Nocardioides sp. zg-DK7169]
MTPDVDAFLALARSSPWRWTTLHLAHRSAFAGACEAWVRRPGELLVRDSEGQWHREGGLPYTRATLTVFTAEETPRPEPMPGHTSVLPHQIAPPLRADGLVERRPERFYLDYDDPMYVNYSWVAMLDPVELSHHVAVDRLRTDVVADRPAWRADLRALPGYDPRCGGNCCELLFSEAGLRADFEDDEEVPERWRGRTYPDHYDVALDVQTGMVVRCLPVGGPDDAPRLENDILEVDADLDQLFDKGRTTPPAR